MGNLQWAICKMQYAVGRCWLSIANCLLSIAYCQLSIVYCLLSIVYCLLPIPQSCKIKGNDGATAHFFFTANLSVQTLNNWWIVFLRIGWIRLGESSFNGINTKRRFCNWG